ncbi:MAG: acireductone synthase [Candidatus Eremiobacteraeota bacterium]|nr:acireductone synthase [Candidatus Eremiobacteraeota bacterium]
MTAVAARAAIVDIEGTTSAIAFVHDVLFPYADAQLDGFVAAHRTERAVQLAMRDAARLAGEPPGVADAAVLARLHRWIADDRKVTPLKTLQGLIWEEGYRRGDLRGDVYADAAEGLRRWHASGIPLYVYSSGSVAAQRSLFGFSERGDLAALFSGWFDTTTGSKRERASYEKIAREIGLAPGDIVFLSDSEAELDAARAAGMQTVRVLRERDTPPGATTAHASAASFDEIAIAPP